jgi:hypothetical protein
MSQPLDLSAALAAILEPIVRRAVADALGSRQAGEDYLSLQQASELSGVGLRALRDHAAGRVNPRLPSSRAGKQLRFKRSDVVAFIEAHAREPEPAAAEAEDDDCAYARKLGLRGT